MGILNNRFFPLCVIVWLLFFLSQACSPGAPQRKKEASQQGDGGLSSQELSTEHRVERIPDSVGLDADTAEARAPEETSTPDKQLVDLERHVDSSTPEPHPVERGPEPAGPCQLPSQAPQTRVKSWQELKVDGNWLSISHRPCELKALRFVAAAGAEIKVEVQAITAGVTMKVGVYNARTLYKQANDPLLASGQNAAFEDWVSLNAAIKQTGETGILIEGNLVPATYQLRLVCAKNCQKEGTRFPVVLLHGFLGTDKYLNILDYFFEVVPHLKKWGYDAYVTKVAPIANSAQRILQLQPQVDKIMADTGARKIHLIAHSQGGIDGRLLIAKLKYGDRVASLTTISTPHLGTPIPDLLIAPSKELSEKNMAQYNKLYPNDPRVLYFSWAGISCAPLDRTCRDQNQGEVVDVLLLALYHSNKGLRGANDGVVTVKSAKWGTFLGEIPADHFDEVGQIADKNNKPFNHKDFYLSELRRLRKADL